MPFRLFQYSLPAEPELTELNQFLAAHRVATVQREVVTTQSGHLLLFIVEYIAGATRQEPSDAGSRIDYRQVLSEADFALFSELRDIRKQVAELEGIPVYAVFTNAQLAAMVQKQCVSVSQIQGIEGIGKARSEKYGERFLEKLVTIFGNKETPPTP